MSGWNPKFDADLQFGQQGERWLMWLGTDQAKVEVKTERDTWMNTKNAVFEFRCRDKPSGITTTQSDYWLHIFSERGQAVMAFLFRVEELKQFLRAVYKDPAKYGARVCKGGDDNRSEVILVPVQELHRVARWPFSALP
jgi:hypothetical protein